MVRLMASKVRLYVDHPLGEGQLVPLSRDQANYLFNVMRLPLGTVVSIFNGVDGEWDAAVAEKGKRGGVLSCQTVTRGLDLPPDLWLLCAPIKKARMDFIVEKAVEMGVRRIVPVQTDYSNERMRQDKLQAHALEAAEQCGATYVPEVAELAKFARILEEWPVGRSLMFCDETLAGRSSALSGGLAVPAAVLIGPEGGFSPAERARLSGMGAAHPVALGPRILRADTAAVAALTLWQATFGDWR